MFAFTQSNHPWVESKGPDRYRRGMYTYIWRQSQHQLLTTFDAADAQVACTQRNRSNTPLQALHLANDPVFVEFADGLGTRIEKDGPKDEAGQDRYAFKPVLRARAEHAEADSAAGVPRREAQGRPQDRVAAVARVLMNLDEFITRE